MSFDVKNLALAATRSFPSEVLALWRSWICGDISHEDFERESYRVMRQFTLGGLPTATADDGMYGEAGIA